MAQTSAPASLPRQGTVQSLTKVEQFATRARPPLRRLAAPSQAEAAPDQAPEGRKPADTVLVPLADCTEGVGLGLSRLGSGLGLGSGLAIASRATLTLARWNEITELTPGGAAARSGLLRLGDRVVGVDGVALEGGLSAAPLAHAPLTLREVLRPAASHTLEVLRCGGGGAPTSASRRDARPVAPIDLEPLDFIEPDSSRRRPTPPPSPPSPAPPLTPATPSLDSVRRAGVGSDLPHDLESFRGNAGEAEPAGAICAGLGGGIGAGLGAGHMRAALRRQMEADQAEAAGADHSLAEAVEAAQAQESLEKTAPQVTLTLTLTRT